VKKNLSNLLNSDCYGAFKNNTVTGPTEIVRPMEVYLQWTNFKMGGIGITFPVILK